MVDGFYPFLPDTLLPPTNVITKSVHGHLEIVRTLLDAHANVHASADYSLRNAVKLRHLDLISLLLARGADRAANNDEALKWATEHGDSEVVAMLMARGDGDEVARASFATALKIDDGDRGAVEE